jgi:hypothetical protein
VQTDFAFDNISPNEGALPAPNPQPAILVFRILTECLVRPPLAACPCCTARARCWLSVCSCGHRDTSDPLPDSVVSVVQVNGITVAQALTSFFPSLQTMSFVYTGVYNNNPGVNVSSCRSRST